MSRSIIVTGASAGIGKTTAETFLKDGWTVGLLARRAEPLQDIAGNYDNAVVLTADVTDVTSVDAAFQTFTDQAGHLDAIFNNAGRTAPAQTIDEVDPEVWRNMVDVNLSGMFYCARAAFRHMRHQDPQGGRIINNGSISATTPRPGTIAYTATKHGVSGLTKTIALDGRLYNIACGQIDIGNALTEMTARMSGGVPQADWSMKSEPTMDVQHIADAVLHMAGLPLESNVLTMTVMATKMPFVGRG